MEVGCAKTGRVLGISQNTMIAILKKAGQLPSINPRYLRKRSQACHEVRVHAVELDEMWSYVGEKAQQCWLWQAMDHQTGEIICLESSIIILMIGEVIDAISLRVNIRPVNAIRNVWNLDILPSVPVSNV